MMKTDGPSSASSHGAVARDINVVSVSTPAALPSTITSKMKGERDRPQDDQDAETSFGTSSPAKNRQHRRYSRSMSPIGNNDKQTKNSRKKKHLRKPWTSDHGGANGDSDDEGLGGGTKGRTAEGTDGEGGGVRVGIQQGLLSLKLPNPPSSLAKHFHRPVSGGATRTGPPNVGAAAAPVACGDDTAQILRTERTPLLGTPIETVPPSDSSSRDQNATADTAATAVGGKFFSAHVIKPVAAIRRVMRTPPRDARRNPRPSRGQREEGGSSDRKKVSFAARMPHENIRGDEESSKLSAVGEAELEDDLSSQSMFPPAQTQSRRWSTQTDADATIVVGPLMDVLTADSTLFFVATLAITSYPTYCNWTTIADQHLVPMSVALSWLLVAFAAGIAIVALLEDWRSRKMVSSMPARAGAVTDDGSGVVPPVVRDPQGHRAAQEEILQAQKRNRHSVFMSALRLSSAKIKFQAAQVPPAVKAILTSKTWTCLNPASRPSLCLWDRTADPTLDMEKNKLLMTRLLRNPLYRRVRKADHLRSQLPLCETKSVSLYPCRDDDLTDSARPMGQFELPDADTLDEFVVVPLLKLRGMDIFMTDEPETEIVTHPWLVEQGLRAVPTLVVNLLTPWANVLIYLEMPSWVSRLSDLEVNEDDEQDVKALKLFLNGDSKYRNLRLRLIPSLVDGPLAIRILAPPKREFLICCDILPVNWRSYDAEIEPKTGRQLAPALQVELDCVSNRVMRGMAGILKRHFESVAIDVAVVIQKPDGQDEDEPEACLAMWRFNHIDVSKCPVFPDRFEYESKVRAARERASPLLDPDVMRASKMVKMSLEEVEILAMSE